MFKLINKRTLQLSAAVSAGMMMGANNAHAAAGGNDWSTISTNIGNSLTNIPGLITALAYLFGILLGTLGVLKIKDHVENPSQTALKDGAIRLAAGGALFALPIIVEAMSNTIGTTGAAVGPAALSAVTVTVG